MTRRKSASDLLRDDYRDVEESIMAERRERDERHNGPPPDPVDPVAAANDRIMADFAAGTPLMEAVIQPDAIEALLMVRGLDALDAAMQPEPKPPADVSPEDPGDLDDFNATTGGY